MSLIAELKRRNVFRVGVAYVIGAWVIAQVADLVLENIEAPDWVMQAIMLVLAIGLPLALILAWAFELTPEGVKREAAVDPDESITHVTGRKLDFAIIGLLVVAVVYFAVDKFVLERAEVTAESVSATESVAREKSIRSLAVLPLENLSSDPEQAYFADATSNELIRELMKIRSLRVPAWTTVRGYKDSPKNAREISEELGVAALVEGTVYRNGNQIRITVQLVDGRDDRHIWAESFDRDFDELLSLQREIAREVAGAVELQLTRQEQRNLAATAKVNPDALDAYIEGIYYLGQNTSLDRLRAIEQFERAVQEDPGFAQAYAMLARAYMNAGSGYLKLPREEAIQNARKAAREALALDDSLALAHTVWGVIAREEWDWGQAEKALRRGYELAPNNPYIMTSLADFLSLSGSHEVAIALSELAVDLAPNDLPLGYRLGVHLYMDRQYDRVLEEAQRLHEINPRWGERYLPYLVHCALGEKEEALRALLDDLRLQDSDSIWLAIIERGLRADGADGAIRALTEAASERVREHGDAAFEVGMQAIELAFLLALVGEVDSMFEWLERGYRLRESSAMWVCVDPVLDPYRSDPRFIDLLRRMNCPEG